MTSSAPSAVPPPPNLASAIGFFAQSLSNAAGDYGLMSSAPPLPPPAYPHDLTHPPPPPLAALNGNGADLGFAGGFRVVTDGPAPPHLAPHGPPPPPPPHPGAAVLMPPQPLPGTSSVLSVLPPPPPPPAMGAPLQVVPRHTMLLSGGPQMFSIRTAGGPVTSGAAVSCSDVTPMFTASAASWLPPTLEHHVHHHPQAPGPLPPHGHPALAHHMQHHQPHLSVQTLPPTSVSVPLPLPVTMSMSVSTPVRMPPSSSSQQQQQQQQVRTAAPPPPPNLLQHPRATPYFPPPGTIRMVPPTASSLLNDFRASFGVDRSNGDGHGAGNVSNSSPSVSVATSFLAHLNPSRWARAGGSRHAHAQGQGRGQSNGTSSSSSAAAATSASAPASSSSAPTVVNARPHASQPPSSAASASPASVGVPGGMAGGASPAARAGNWGCPVAQSTVAANKEKIKTWIMERAAQIEKEYEVLTRSPGEEQPVGDISRVLDSYWKSGIQREIKVSLAQAGDILTWLSSAVKELRAARSEHECIQSLKTIGAIVKFLDISPFEMTHSELVPALLEFLTAADAPPASSASGTDVAEDDATAPAAATAGVGGEVVSSAKPSSAADGAAARDRKRSRGSAGGRGGTGAAAAVEIRMAPSSLGGQDGGPPRLPPRLTRMRIFAHVFLGCSLDPLSSKPADAENAFIKCLVPKLVGCLHQIEQFSVRVHDLPGGNSVHRNGASAIKFFNTHHLKCNLQRHPDCNTLRKWKAGPVKIDPLALVSSVERYMVMKGYGRPRAAGYPDDDSSRPGHASSSSGLGGGSGSASASAAAAGDDESDDDASDDELDDTLAAMAQNHGRHKLEFLVNGHVLPFSMTVYQAVRQFSNARPGNGSAAAAAGIGENSETDTDSEAPMGGANIWVQTHTIYYRPYTDPDPPQAPSTSSTASNVVSGFLSGRCNKGGRSASSQAVGGSGHLKSGSGGKIGKGKGSGSGGDLLWSEGVVGDAVSTLTKIPTDGRLPGYVAVNDPSLPVLSLLRAVFIINRHWGDLYAVGHYKPVIPTSEFISGKLTAKANRQLQDPLVIMTGNIPPWLHQIAQACPFAFPFDTRQLLFYAVTFDRDRAMHRLLESQPELNQSSSDRVTPRLEKRKRTIGRDELLKQAENVINEMASSRALLEIEYENEVGTGLGPTLEFYTLVSRELQRHDLELWRGEKGPAQVSYAGHGQTTVGHGSKKSHESAGAHGPQQHCIHFVRPHGSGLFPMPLGRGAKPNVVARHRAKFKLIGKLIGKAIMDSRMLDLPLNPLVYKWLKGDTMCASTLPPVPPVLASSASSSSSGGGRGKGKAAAKHVQIDAPVFVDADVAELDPGLARTYYQLLAVVHKKERLEAQKREKMAAAGGAPDETPGSPKITSLDEIKEEMGGGDDDGIMDFDTIEDLGLDFTMPGNGSIELRKGGKDIPVTIHNLKQYLKLVRHWSLVEGVARQMDALREGFESVFPANCLNLFFPEEMEMLCCGGAAGTGGGPAGARWDLRTLMDCCRPDHGYTHDSRAVRWFFEILSTYDLDEQRRFLQFVTGSPCLPVGGFKSLTPPLTIVRKTMGVNENPDDFLPSVMTCVNYLKLPDYTSAEIMREKLRVAAMEGQYSFHLS